MECTAVAAVPPQRHPNLVRADLLADEIGELAGYLNSANCRLLDLIAEFDTLGGWADQGAKSCAHWLNWKCGIGLNAGREKVRAARALQQLPEMHAAFAAGRISYSKVRAMTRVATPENEGYLLHIAIYGTASHVERLVRGYRSCLRDEAGRAAANDRHDGRYCHHHWDEDGCLVVTARLSPEQGAVVLRALEAGATEIEAERADDAAADFEHEAPGDVTAVTSTRRRKSRQ